MPVFFLSRFSLLHRLPITETSFHKYGTAIEGNDTPNRRKTSRWRQCFPGARPYSISAQASGDPTTRDTIIEVPDAWSGRWRYSSRWNYVTCSITNYSLFIQETQKTYHEHSKISKKFCAKQSDTLQSLPSLLSMKTQCFRNRPREKTFSKWKEISSTGPAQKIYNANRKTGPSINGETFNFFSGGGSEPLSSRRLRKILRSRGSGAIKVLRLLNLE